MKSEFHFSDSAFLAFQPIINLKDSPFSNLSSRAATYWLNLDQFPAQLGAFMHFYGPTRKLLKVSGLDLCDENFTLLKSENEKWNDLLDQYKSHKLSNTNKLYFIRLLYYLGFYTDGMQICDEILQNTKNEIETLWSVYLKDLGNSIIQPLTWHPSNLINEINKLNTSNCFILSSHISLLISKYYIRRCDNFLESENWLNNLNISFIENNIDHFILYTRMMKYRADSLFLQGKKEAAEKMLIACFDKINEFAVEKLNENSNFLLTETKRRVLDALTFQCFDAGKKQDALNYALKAVEIDPYCSYALTIAGFMASNEGSLKCASACFYKASHFGTLERSYSKGMLAKINDSESQKNALIDDAIQCNLDFSILSNPNKYVALEHINIPSQIQYVQKLASENSEENLWKKFKLNSSYQRFLPFWELNSPTLDSPIFSHVPLVALEISRNQYEPWYETIYLQRAMPVSFRRDLFLATSPTVFFAQKNLDIAVSIDILKDRSQQMDWMLSSLKNIDKANKLSKIFLCRLLGSLGYYKHALDYLPLIDRNSQWKPEDEYNFCTQLFYKNIYCVPTQDFPYEDLDFAYHKLSSLSQSLRMKLNLTILGTVYTGQKKDLANLKIWRERGFKALQDIQSHNSFSDFEKQLLSSRFYRAVSYYPFLLKDQKESFREAELCESFARKLIPKTDKQVLLKRENMFPMLESMSRIYFQFGENERSSKLMEELVFDLDPHDTKAWIQLGDLKEKLNCLQEAKEAFQKACSIGSPLSGLAWYRMGRLSEKMGDNEWAKYCYFASQRLNPLGISPLKRLKELSEDLYVKYWCENNLTSLRNL